VLPIMLVVAVPALAQVSGGNDNIIICANIAAQDAQAAVDAQDDAQATLLNLLNQLNRCGVFVSDAHTTVNHDTTVNDNVTQKANQAAKSGNINTTADVSNSGANEGLCAPIMQGGNNTGNDQTGQQFTPFDTNTGSTQQTGNASELSPELTVQCAPEINQAAPF
jgi:hypothetical protein